MEGERKINETSSLSNDLRHSGSSLSFALDQSINSCSCQFFKGHRYLIWNVENA